MRDFVNKVFAPLSFRGIHFNGTVEPQTCPFFYLNLTD